MNNLDFLTRDGELVSMDNMGNKIIVPYDVVYSTALIINLTNKYNQQ